MTKNNIKKKLTNLKITSAIQKFFGWTISILCGVVVLVGGTQISEMFDVVMVSIFAVFTALGILLIVKGRKKAKLIKKFQSYSTVLETDPEKSIMALSKTIGEPFDEVENNVKALLSYGLFPHTYMDVKAQKLVTPQKEIEYVIVECENCGGQNKIAVGSLAICEFCGSKIEQ